jgi:thiol-disulfide isomerase/thioredoxin
MKAKHIIFIFLLSFALLILGGLVRSHGFIYDIPVSQILFAITAFVLVRKGILKGKWMYYVLPFAVLFWHTFAFFFDNIFSNFHEWEYITTGTPNILLCAVGATYGALLALKARLRIAGIALFLLCAACSAWYMTRGIEYWINYCANGSFTGKVEEGRVGNWQQVVNPSDTVQRDHYKDKYVVLDFWSMSCVVCFKKFPKLDSLNRQYKDNSEVLFEAVNLPIKDDSLKFERSHQLNEKYTFPTVFADSSAARIFKINGVPTVIILKNDEVIFRGSIELAQDFLIENLKP